MMKEILQFLEPKNGKVFIDCTFGAGGHSYELLKNGATVIAIDRDINNKFVYNLSNAVKILYNQDGFSSSNSVADNKVVGLYIGSNNTKISYQAEIINIIKKQNLRRSFSGQWN